MANNVTVDFTTNVCTVDPLAVGITISTYKGGGSANINLSTTWKNLLAALAPGHCRIPLRWNGGNPGSSAGGAQTSGDADTYIGNIKAIGAIPFVVYGGDTSDNGGINASDAAAFVHHYNDSGGLHNGPVKYWVVGNEPDVSGGTGPYEAVVGPIVAAMHGADGTVKVSAPAAGFWDTGLLSNASVTGSGLDILSYHAYDGGNTDGTGFPTDPQYYNHVHTDLPGFKAGIMYGMEETNWSPSYTGQTQFYDWHNTCFLADVAGQVLSAGGHFTQYADSNGALSLMNDGSGLQAQPGSFGTTLPAYWGVGVWTGMNGQFKRWGAHMVSASSTFAQGVLTAFACDNGKIVIVNKDGVSSHALTIGLTLAAGATSGTYNVWATQQGAPTGAITEVVTGAAFSGSVINYTIPAGTAVSIDVTAGAPAGVLLTNNLEGGTNAVTITTGNSGGASGNAFDGTTLVNGALTFSSTQKAHGSLSMAVSTTGAGGQAAVNWNGQLGTQSTVYGRAYIYLPSSPAVDDTIIQFLSGFSFAGGIMATASGLLATQNAAFGITLGPSLPTAQWLRLEWKVVCGAAGAASLTVNYYVGDSVTVAGTITDTAGGYGIGGSINEVSYGWNTNHPSQPLSYFDDLGLSTTGFLGPSGTVSSSVALSGSGTLTAAGTAGGTGLLVNSFDGGSNTTAITTGNSGGASGNAFSAVSTVAGGVTQFSSTQKAHGALSGQFSTGVTSGVSVVEWTSGVVGTQATLYGRAYVYLTANPGNDDNIAAFYGGAASFAGGIMIASSGQLRIQNATFGEVSGGPTMPLNQWFRLEWKFVCGSAGSASATLNYYSSPDSGTITNTLTDTAGAYGSGGSMNEVHWGWTGGHASQPTLYLDSIGLATAGFLGPAGANVAGAAALSGTGTLTAPGVKASASAMSGVGTLFVHGTAFGAAPLSGAGTLGLGPAFRPPAVMSGLGTLTAPGTKITVAGPSTFTGAIPGSVGLTGAGPGALQPGMPGSTPPIGYQGGPAGLAKIAPSGTNNGWEIFVRSGLDYTALLAQIPNSMLLNFQFVRQLDDIGSGTVTLNQDDPWWRTAGPLPGGLPTSTLLDEECLWQVWKDGVCRFEFLGETITEQLVDPSEQRQVTVTGPGTIAVLKWAMAAPEGFPNIVLKLDGILDTFDEVDANGNGVLDTNVWTTASPASHIYITPIATLFNYPQGAGYALSTLYPSGSLTIVASPTTTFLGATPYDATDTLISAQVTPLGVAANPGDAAVPAKYGAGLNGSELTQFYIQSNKNHAFYALFGLSASAFYAQMHDSTGTFTKILPAYNPANHAYWMITEQGGSGGGAGTFYWWTSPDGQKWTLQWHGVHHFDATNCTFFITAAYSADSKVSVQLTNLNSNVSTPSYQGAIYLGSPMMDVWLDQFAKAQARGTIPFVTTAVTTGHDTYGRPWTDVQNVQTVNGTDLYSLLQGAVSVVNADYVMDPGFQLRVGQPAAGQVSLGVDRSNFLIFREGRDALAKQRVRARNQIATLIGGENSDGHEISASSPAFIAQWGQREAWFQTSVQVDPVSMAYASAASLAENETEIVSWTLSIAPNLPGKTVFDDFDVGDWVGLEKPDFSGIDDIRVVGIAVQVDSGGNETHELTVNSYIQWLAEQLTYLAGKLGGAFVNTLGTTPVAPSKYGTGQVPTYYTPAATLAGLADVAGASGTSTLSSAPLVYNPATGQYQHAGSTDPVTGAIVGTVVGAPGQGSVSTLPAGTKVTDPAGTVRQVIGMQPDGTVTTVDLNGPAPGVPDIPAVGPVVQGVTIAWDGLLAGAPPLADFAWTEFHLGLSPTFTPGPTTLLHTQPTAAGISVTGLTQGVTYWAKLVAVNTSGAKSAPSTAASATATGVPGGIITGQLPASVLGNSAGSWAMNPNPFFNGGDLSGWIGNGGTLTATSVVPGSAPGNPPWVAQFTSTVGGGDMEGSPSPFPVVAGQPYSFTAWVYNPSGSPVSVQIGFNWAAGTQTFSVPPGVWSPLVCVQVAPTGATLAYQLVQCVSSGVTIYVSGAVVAGQINGQLIAASTVTAQQIAVGIILAGVVDGTLIQGAQFVSYGATGEVLVYSGTPAVGNLIGSWSATAGNDAAIAGGAGNSYPAGLMIGTPGSSQLQFNPQANQPFNLTNVIAGVLTAAAQLVSGDAAEQFAGVIGAVNLGSGATAKQTLVALSPMASGTGAAMLLESQNDGGTDTPVVTFGTVSSPDASTLVFAPLMALFPYAMVLYSGVATQVVVTKTAGSGTIPIPGGVTSGKGEVWGAGGGGGGGGGPDTADPGGGGGGGEYACEPALALTGGGTASYAVGAGGLGGAATNGTAGGISTLSGTSVTVTGHGGGGGLIGLGGTGGSNGTGSANSIVNAGGRGGNTAGPSGNCGGGGGGGSGGTAAAGRAGSFTSSNAPGAGAVAVGGGGAGGNGGRGSLTNTHTNGLAGVAPGGGGGGGGNGSHGANGAAGQVRLTYVTGTPSVGFVLNYGGSFTDQYGNTIPAGPNLSTDSNGALVVPTNVEMQPPGYSPATPGTGIKLFADASATAITSLDKTGFSTRLPLTGAADFTSRTVTQATQTQLGTAWTIPANNAQVGTTYRVTCKGFGTWGSTQQFLQLVGAVNGTNVTEGSGIGRIAAATFAISTAFRWKAVFLVEINAIGSGGTCIPTLEYTAVAAVANIQPGTAAANSVTSVTGPTGTSAAVATNASFTVRIDALWGNVTGAPTITHVSTHFERMGP